jgi:hypothetical protein
VVGETDPDRVWCGQHQGADPVDRRGPIPAGRALGHHQRADRFDVSVASLRQAAGSARQGRSSGGDGVERVGLPGLAAGGTICPVDLEDGDAEAGEVAGEAGAVAARALDPDPLHAAEAAEPAGESGVAGGGGRERLDAEQAADLVERSGDVNVQVGVNAAGHGACLYDGHCHPFLG